MQQLMVKSGRYYRQATRAEVAEVSGEYARKDLNRARPMLANPLSAVVYLQAMYAGRDHETFTVLFLDIRFQLIEAVEMFRGTIDGASVYPREVAKECLWRGAACIVVAHNHPSGVAEPSQADLFITQRLREALALIDVRLLDHLIIGAGSYYSMSEHGDLSP